MSEIESHILHIMHFHQTANLYIYQKLYTLFHTNHSVRMTECLISLPTNKLHQRCVINSLIEHSSVHKQAHTGRLTLPLWGGLESVYFTSVRKIMYIGGEDSGQLPAPPPYLHCTCPLTQ
jgi:hypothetical protein